MVQKVYNYYESDVISEDLNERFADFLGGSILSGYRLAAGSLNRQVSILRGGDGSSVMVTWTGAKIVEDADVADVISLDPNGSATDRMDSIYAVYVHGFPNKTASYVAIIGDAAGLPAPAQNPLTHTLVGYVRVPAGGVALTPDCFISRPKGWYTFRVAGQSTFVGDVDFKSKVTIENLPASGTDGVNKLYVDSLQAGLFPKENVRVTTTGSDIVLSGLFTLDAVALAVEDRVLVRDQANPAENGLYVARNTAWIRAADADNSNATDMAEVKSGIFCMVNEGTLYQGSGWFLIATNPVTLGTTPLQFRQLFAAGQSIAGEGLSKVGNQLAVVPATKTTLGGVKNGDGIEIAADGTITADLGAGLTFTGGSPDKKIVPDFSASGGTNGIADKVAREDHYHEEVMPYSIYSTAYDGTVKVYTHVQHKRRDGTLHIDSLLSGLSGGHYGTLTIKKYDLAGTAILSTDVWTLTYDANGRIVTKALN